MRPFAEQGAVRVVLALRHHRLDDFVGIDIVGLPHASLPALVDLASDDGPLPAATYGRMVGLLDDDD